MCNVLRTDVAPHCPATGGTLGIGTVENGNDAPEYEIRTDICHLVNVSEDINGWPRIDESSGEIECAQRECTHDCERHESVLHVKHEAAGKALFIGSLTKIGIARAQSVELCIPERYVFAGVRR